MKKNFGAIFFGLLLVLMGVGSIGLIFDIWTWSDIGTMFSTIFFDGWWSFFLIIPCAIGLVKKDGKILNLAGIIIGILLLLNAQGVEISKNILYSIVPILIIGLGLSIMYTGFFGKKAKVFSKIPLGNCNHSCFFGSDKPTYAGRVYTGGKCTAAFSNLDLNLNDGYINQNCRINCNCFFSDIDIKLPPNVRVEVTNKPIFGKLTNNFMNCPDVNVPTVFVSAVTIFGDVNIW
ncbi:MAG: hypothetical protein R3Y27_08700 [Clostridia bacterium]